MANQIHALTKDLPESVRKALHALAYGKRDIAIQAAESVSVGQGGGDGRRSFYAIVALDGSVEHKIEYGSWGGVNAFENRRVDNDHTSHPILPGFAVITGSSGSNVYATMHVHPSNMAPLLPMKVELSERLRVTLKVFKELTSMGRKNEWEIYNPSSKPTVDELNELVHRGLLKRNKAGAMRITTEGKNAIQNGIG
jgi:hypothetical protein